jgi:hypothetical protein
MNFFPTAPGLPVFVWSGGGAMNARCGISGIGFTSLNVVDQKIMVRLIDIDTFLFQDLQALPGNWTGAGSIGLQIRGRQKIRCDRLTIGADVPISIEVNPNIASIGLDSSDFSNCLLLAGSGQPSIRVADGVVLLNSVWRMQNWVGGNCGFYWVDTTSPNASHDLAFLNIRMEQAAGAAIAFLTLSSLHQSITNVTVRNCLMGGSAATAGVVFGNVKSAVLDNCSYVGTAPWLTIDNNCTNIYARNFDRGSGTSGIAALSKVFFSDNDGMKLLQGILPQVGTLTGLGATGTATILANSSDRSGVIQLAPAGAGTTATGSFTFTFDIILASQCQVLLALEDGTATPWTDGATIKVVSQTNANFVAKWSNNGVALTAGSPYNIFYLVIPRDN